MNSRVLKHFKEKDHKISSIIEKYNVELPTCINSSMYFFEICRNIAYQQLTDKAASKIFGRLQKHLNHTIFTPDEILELDIETLRGFGFSYSKSQYIKNIALHTKIFNFNTLGELSNEEIVEELTKIKGIGEWSVQMFLIFSLGREDVFPTNDLGIKKAIKKLYEYSDLPTREQMNHFKSIYTPFSTIATLSLWKYLDNRE